jgi:hypothetical protein
MLNLLTFFGAAIGVAIAYGAFDQTRRQAAAAEEQLAVGRADQRAWIDISKLAMADDIVFDENGARISLSFEVTNVGKSPAFAADPWISAFINGMSGAPNETYLKPTVSITVPAENILFPGRPVTRTATGYVATRQLAQIVTTSNRFFPPTVEVCVSYRLASLLDEHKTCHTLLLVAKEGLLMSLLVPPARLSGTQSR